MFRHVVLLTLRDDLPSDQLERLLESLRRLPGLIPEIRSYVVGVDVGLAETNATLAVVADFDDVVGFETYATHPAHVEVITEQIRPVLVARSAVQHEVDGAGATR